MTALVDYLVARGGPTEPSGLAYDYVLGGDGLFVAAHNRYLDVRVPVATAPVRGLAPLFPSFTLRTGRLLQGIWDVIVAASCAWARLEGKFCSASSTTRSWATRSFSRDKQPS